MASHFIGIDIGSSTVRWVVLKATSRYPECIAAFEHALPPDQAMNPQAAPFADIGTLLQPWLKQHSLRIESASVSIEEKGMFHTLSFPFSDRKKIEQVLSAEVENVSLIRADEYIFDFLPIRSNPGTQITSVLAAGCSKSAIAAALSTSSTWGVQVRSITPKALAVVPLQLRLQPGLFSPPVAFLELGHRASRLCVLSEDGEPVVARILPQGGLLWTLQLARALKQEPTEAQRIKHALSAEELLTTPSSPAGTVVQQGLYQLCREIRQTLATLQQPAFAPEELLLTGGGAQLQGICDFLQRELGLPVRLWSPPPTLRFPADAATAWGPAIGLAWQAAHPNQGLNFRQNEFAYRSYTQLLRSHVVGLTIVAALLIALLVGSFAANAYAHERVERVLTEALRAQSAAVLGKSTENPSDIKQTLSSALSTAREAAPPVMGPVALLQELIQGVPPEVKWTLTEWSIKKQSLTLSGQADTIAMLEQIEKSWKKIDCLEEIKRGDTKKISARDPARPDAEVEQFQMTISHRCF